MDTNSFSRQTSMRNIFPDIFEVFSMFGEHMGRISGGKTGSIYVKKRFSGLIGHRYPDKWIQTRQISMREQAWKNTDY